MVKSLASRPSLPVIAVRGNPTILLEKSGHVDQIPCHECRIALRKVIGQPDYTVISIRRSRPRFTDPAGIALGRYGVPQMLQRVENVHCTMLDAVLVSGDNAACHTAIIRGLALIVEFTGKAIKPFIHWRTDGGVVPFTLLNVTGTAKTKGFVRAANRAGCRQAAPNSVLSNDLLGSSSDLITACFYRLQLRSRPVLASDQYYSAIRGIHANAGLDRQIRRGQSSPGSADADATLRWRAFWLKMRTQQSAGRV